VVTERVALVTGAGRGIGRAHALALAAAGARVVVNDLGVEADGARPHRGPAAAVVDEIVAGGGAAVASYDDVATDDGAAAMVQLALDAYGRLDAVVNNAGILRSGLLLRTNADAWCTVLEVHLLGTMLVTQAAARHWREESKAGRPVDARVVNTSSSAGLYGFVGEPAYSAAKAGIVGFTLTAAAELERYGVTVNAIAPMAATRLTAWASPAHGDHRDDPALAPELVSPLVVWLAGASSAGVTGRVFEVGGGVVHVLDGWQRAETLDQGDDVDDLGARVRAALDRLPPPVPVTVPTTS
jgi:NAD(P)-dependent dehydrogenase (short-subunit alcohol dehydrogenase family)